MRVHKLDVRRFRGFEAITIVPAGHVLLVGEPGAGRSDVIEALGRVLSPESTRTPSEYDFYRQDTRQAAEVEVVLGMLGEELEQVFFEYLEVWDRDGRQMVDQTADPETIDRDRYDFVYD